MSSFARRDPSCAVGWIWIAPPAAGHSLGGMTSVVTCALDRRFKACVNLDGGLDAGERYPRTEQPILAPYGGPSPVKMPIEMDEGFAKRRENNAKFLQSPGHLKTLEQYSNAERGLLAYVVSPGYSHFAYYDLKKPASRALGRNSGKLAPESGDPPQMPRHVSRCHASDAARFCGEAMRAIDARLMIVPFGAARP